MSKPSGTHSKRARIQPTAEPRQGLWLPLTSNSKLVATSTMPMTPADAWRQIRANRSPSRLRRLFNAHGLASRHCIRFHQPHGRRPTSCPRLRSFDSRSMLQQMPPPSCAVTARASTSQACDSQDTNRHRQHWTTTQVPVEHLSVHAPKTR